MAVVPDSVLGTSTSSAAVSSPTFEDWLLSVESSGALLVYREALEENFDTVGQVLTAYTLDDGGLQAFDEKLFEDIGVENAEHRQLFDRWIYCGGWHGSHSGAGDAVDDIAPTFPGAEDLDAHTVLNKLEGRVKGNEEAHSEVSEKGAKDHEEEEKHLDETKPKERKRASATNATETDGPQPVSSIANLLLESSALGPVARASVHSNSEASRSDGPHVFDTVYSNVNLQKPL